MALQKLALPPRRKPPSRSGVSIPKPTRVRSHETLEQKRQRHKVQLDTAASLSAVINPEMPFVVEDERPVLYCDIEQEANGNQHVAIGCSPHGDIVLCPKHLRDHMLLCDHPACLVLRKRGFYGLIDELLILTRHIER